MAQILSIKGRQIYDSRGNPTVQCEIKTHSGIFIAAVPSGASTGKYQALELRDKNPNSHMGKGVIQAVDNVNQIISKQLTGKIVKSQSEIDKKMVEQLDGQQGQFGWNKSKLGANSILAVSMAVCKASSSFFKIPLYKYINTLLNQESQKFKLPCPAFNVINGGKHGGNDLAMQQFMIVPTGAQSFKEAMQIGTEVYHHLSLILKKKYGLSATNVGDQGGFAPNISGHQQALQLISAAIQNAGHTGKISIAMDCAASQFFVAQKQSYDLGFKSSQPKLVTREELLKIYEDLSSRYPIISIQDGFDEDDFEGWKLLTEKLSNKVQIVGDDLLVTNLQRIEKAMTMKACNALLLKINQIGSITEAIEAAQLAMSNKWNVMVSHRSGETEDTFIADLVVGLGCGQIKSGAPCRSQRLAKYNQLLRIQEQLGQKCSYAGLTAFKC